MLTSAPHTHYATGPHGTAILDVRRGTWMMLDPDASKIWHAITMRGGTAELADEIAVPAGLDAQAVGEQITAFIDQPVSDGVLIDTDRSRCRGWWR